MTRLLTGILSALLVALSLLPALGQTEKVDIRLKLLKGEALAYEAASSSRATLIAPAVQNTGERKVEALEMHRVLDVGPEGVMTVEIFEDSMKVTAEGKTEEAWRIPLTIRVHPTGLVIERVSGVYTEPDEFPLPLPPGPVGVGDTWYRDTTAGLNVDGAVTRTYTLVGIDRSGGEAIARIQLRQEGTITLRGNAPLLPGAQIRTSGKAQGSGEIIWSLDRGRILRETETLTMEFEQDITAQGQSVKSRLTTTTSERRELLAQSPAPAVPPLEALIVPGKTLGQFALGISMADLTARFGQPVPEPELGLQSRRLRWSNGLVAHVHPGDGNRILGLEITDRKYRTDKGIGFRSSEGATLFAYGLNPAKFELVSVRLGDYLALVYNDLGIAFGIRTDHFGTLLGREHPPLGTVEFIVVFPPGSAPAIFGP